MSKVTREVAEGEVTSWLEKKKILDVTIEQNKDSIETLIGAICQGCLTLDAEKWEWRHKLLTPLEGELPVTELVYAPRLNDKMVRPYMKNVKTGDSLGHLNAYVSALTRQPSEVIANIDSVDKKICMAIAVFFL